jgi:hypothetical protein
MYGFNKARNLTASQPVRLSVTYTNRITRFAKPVITAETVGKP